MAAGSILVVKDDVGATPVSGMTIQIYVANSTTVSTSGVTDSSGLFGFLLPDGSYDVRYYLQGASIVGGQPQRIVVDGAQSNNFKTVTHLYTYPESSDPISCRVTGFIYGSNGLPLPGYKIYFTPTQDPVVINNNLVPYQSSFYSQSDESGFVDFYLLRGMVYKAYTENRGMSSTGQIISSELSIKAPNLPGILLHQLLYPVPVSLTFPVSTLNITLIGGPYIGSTPAIAFSDGNTRTEMPSWASVSVSSSNSAIVIADLLSDCSLVLTPKSAGTATVQATRNVSSSAMFSSLPSFTSNILTVTVL